MDNIYSYLPCSEKDKEKWKMLNLSTLKNGIYEYNYSVTFLSIRHHLQAIGHKIHASTHFYCTIFSMYHNKPDMKL